MAGLPGRAPGHRSGAKVRVASNGGVMETAVTTVMEWISAVAVSISFLMVRLHG